MVLVSGRLRTKAQKGRIRRQPLSSLSAAQRGLITTVLSCLHPDVFAAFLPWSSKLSPVTRLWQVKGRTPLLGSRVLINNRHPIKVPCWHERVQGGELLLSHLKNDIINKPLKCRRCSCGWGAAFDICSQNLSPSGGQGRIPRWTNAYTAWQMLLRQCGPRGPL